MPSKRTQQSTAASLNISVNISVVSVYALALVLSACSLLYELLIAQTLTLIAANMVVWYSLTVGTYLAAMGVGAILCNSFAWFQSWKLLFRIEIMLSVLGAFAVILLELMHTLYIMFEPGPIAMKIAMTAFFTFAFIITFLIGMLTGMELPLLIKLGNHLAGNRHVTNRVLGWDYMGALVGGVVFPLCMLPFLPLHTIGFLIAAINLIAAAYILWRFLSHTPGLALKTLGCIIFAAVLVAGCTEGESIEQFFMKKYYYYHTLAGGHGGLFDRMRDKPKVFRESSPYQKIDIVQFPNLFNNGLIDAYSTKFTSNPSMPRNYAFFLNGDDQFVAAHEELYHEWLAHVPIIINGKVPKRILVLGGGDGLLHRELLKYKEVKCITQVDIDKKLVKLAKTHPFLTAVNDYAYDDPRVHTIYGDAYQYLRKYKGEPYDAIYMDFPDIADYNLAKLYSREFFHFANRSIKNDGFVALDTPGVFYGKEPENNSFLNEHRGDFDILDNTAWLAGFKSVIPFYSILEVDNPRADKMLTGRTDQVRIAYLNNYTERMQEGFMLLRKDERYGPFKYIDFGIKLHILNEKRFKLSLPELEESEEKVDLRQVNSILRPTLPDGMLWYIRSLK